MANNTFMEQLNGIVSQVEYIESLERQLSEALNTLSRISRDLLKDRSSVRILCAISKDAVSQINTYQSGLSETRLDTRCKYAKFLVDDAINYRSVMEAVTAETLKEEST